MAYSKIRNAVAISGFCGFMFVTQVFSATLLVGPSRSYKTPNAVSGLVKDGDTVLIDTGTYAGEVSTWTKNNLTLRGVGRFAHLVAPSTISNGKAIWVIQGSNTTIENIEFSGASVPDQNGAGIRQEGNNVTIRNCFFHDDEDGILGGGNATSSVVIENSEFANCGYGDGYSHNMYISNIGSFTLKSCYSHGTKEGHLVKTRARVNYILYNRLTDESGATASYELSFPDAGIAYVVGNLIEQCATTHNPAIIDYASEHFYYADAKELYVVNNTVVNDRSGGTFVQVAPGATAVKIINNLFVGTGTLLSSPGDTSHNIQATTAAFVNQSAYDYRPTSAFTGINQGVDPGSANGFSLAPVLQYVHPLSSKPRAVVGGAIDIGAYEYSVSAIGPGKIRLLPTLRASSGAWYTINGRMAAQGVNGNLHSMKSAVLLLDSRGNRMVGIK